MDNKNYSLNLEDFAELEKSLEKQYNLYLEVNDELIKSDIIFSPFCFLIELRRRFQKNYAAPRLVLIY